MDNPFDWIALTAADGVGPVMFRRLLERFETPGAVLSASIGTLSSVRGMTEQMAHSIKGDRCRRFAELETSRLNATTNTRLIAFVDPEYPRHLIQIGSPPPLLYIRGKMPQWDPAVAMVGSRRSSRDGIKVAERLAADIAGAGLLVVSGLARGIDTAAHRGALAGGGHTVAVLGSGVDVPYPPENIELAEKVMVNGCLVSEFPLGTQPLAEHFPRRNRIISGLSRAVLVVEATEKSGSLITAGYALEQGRDLLAVPGPAFSASNRGSNRLIKEGAMLVDSADDLFNAIGFARHQQGLPFDSPVNVVAPSQPLTPREAAIYELLSRGALHLDDITDALELTAGEVSAMVLSLELKGMLTRLPGSYYSIS